MIETFDTVIEGRPFTFLVYPCDIGYGWWATVTGMSEPGSPAQAQSLKSKEDAILQLVEKLQEAILENRI